MDEPVIPRLEALESKVAYLEATVQDLSHEVWVRTGRMEKLETLVRELSKRVKDLSASEAPPMAADQRPPHY